MKRFSLLLLASSLACAPAGDGDASRDTSDARSAETALDSPVAWRFAPPDSWGERARPVDIAADELASRFAAARAVERFDYFPRDSSLPPQPLLLITVYDSAAWVGVERAGNGAGEVITRERGMVYVATLPSEAPYPAGSVDARDYAARLPTIEQVRAGFQVVSSR